MKEIKLRYEHKKLIFKIGKEDYWINSDDILSLLDRQRTSEWFHSLDPAVVYAEWENFDFVAKLEALKERGLSLPEIADFTGTTKERLEGWMSERATVIKQIKERNPSNFAAAVRGLKGRLIIKRRS